MFFQFCEKTVATVTIWHIFLEGGNNGLPKVLAQSPTYLIEDNNSLRTLNPECDGYQFKKCEIFVATFSSFSGTVTTQYELSYLQNKKYLHRFTVACEEIYRECNE